MDIIIYGSTSTGRRIYEELKRNNNVLCFLDDDSSKWGEKIDGICVYDPQSIASIEFDEVVIGVLTYHLEVLDNLIKMGVPKNKINETFINIPTYARMECLRNIRTLVDEESIGGNVAELGVFRGEFAREINKIFPDRKLYLFDTFEGFSKHDTDVELNKGYSNEDKTGYFSNTTEQDVLSLMPYPEMCVIKKGYFPDTAVDLDDSFCFVNLDADLYAPTLAGLQYFYPRLKLGG